MELLDRRAGEAFVDVDGYEGLSCFCHKHFSPATVTTNAVTIQHTFSWRPMKRDEGEGQIHCVTLPRVPSRRNSQYSYSCSLLQRRLGTRLVEEKRKKKKSGTCHVSWFVLRTTKTQGSPYRMLMHQRSRHEEARSNLPDRSALLHPGSSRADTASAVQRRTRNFSADVTPCCSSDAGLTVTAGSPSDRSSRI